MLPAGDWIEPGNKDFTLELWYYTSSINTRQWFLHSNTDYWLGLDIWNQGYGARLGIWASSSGTNWTLSSDPGREGIGNIVLQSNKWRGFVDGIKCSEVTSDFTIVNRGAQTKFLGKHSNGNYLRVVGNIQRFQFTHEALYTNNFTPK